MSISVEEAVPANDKSPPLNRDKHTHLRSIIDRLVRIEEGRKALAEDMKEIFMEAKSRGFNGTSIRILVKEIIEEDEKRIKREAAEAETEWMRSALQETATTH